jgi:hypothetical protein
MAFFSALSLLIIYHRFYDEQLLLMVIPFLLLSFNRARRAGTVVLWLAMLALAFPLHVGSDHFTNSLRADTFLGFFVLHPLPLIVLGMCVLLVPWAAGTASEQTMTTSEIAKSRVAGR